MIINLLPIPLEQCTLLPILYTWRVYKHRGVIGPYALNRDRFAVAVMDT